MLSKVFILFPHSINDTEIAGGLVVPSLVKTGSTHDDIEFKRFTDTALVTETIWSREIVKKIVFPILHRMNIDTHDVHIAESF